MSKIQTGGLEPNKNPVVPRVVIAAMRPDLIAKYGHRHM